MAEHVCKLNKQLRGLTRKSLPLTIAISKDAAWKRGVLIREVKFQSSNARNFLVFCFHKKTKLQNETGISAPFLFLFVNVESLATTHG